MPQRGVRRRAGVPAAAAAAAAAATVALACRPDLGAPNPCERPEIVSRAVVANPTNVLSAAVVGRAAGADSLGVRLESPSVRLESTVSVRSASSVSDSGVVVPVLGLLPQTTYSMRLVAYNACGEKPDDVALSFTTGALPADLPSYTTSGADPAPGFVAMNAGQYGLVIDNTGRVVWYRRFPPNGPGLNFQPQPNGRYAVRPPTAPADSGLWMEIDVLGNMVRGFRCARGLQPRFHDLIALTDGTYWIMCDETRSMDLRPYGGAPNAQVTGTVVQHVGADGALLFEWSPFDHFAITDLDSLDRTSAVVNWTHGNAIDFDSDSNLVVSFRSLNEITKINATTGAVMWRMGGRAGQFALQDPSGATTLFARQHGVRVTSSGALQLLDNLSDPRASRVRRVSYLTDAAPSAQSIATFESDPPVVALLGGSTQELPNGHVLAAYGNGNRVEEYDAAGNVVWHIEGNPGYVFRATRFPSLYKPGIGYHR